MRWEFDSVPTLVDGAWTGHPASDLPGNLFDQVNHMNIREITLEANR
jgi:hypothetical protein